MSSIDRRIVEMNFDNKQFEQGVQTSLSTLEKLKQGLNLGSATTNVNDLAAATKNFDMANLASNVETVSSKFSALGIVGVRVLQNITDSVYNTGTQLAKSLSVDQITAGWDKYSQKTQAVQTIMAATAKQFTDTDVQMAYVNDQLSQLNWYTDETSYNFLDMVNNIGKFTANNIGLEDSVTAMQGISNWAAISGANVGEAGRAMYNLSQAIAIGSVKLMDWKSIENANMATAQFKETAIETALAVGTLKKDGDGLIKTMKGNEVSVSSFNVNLSDAWFSTEVLMQTLDKYGGFANKLYDVTEKTGITTTELLRHIDDFTAGTLDISSLAEETGISVEELSKDLEELGSTTFELGRRSFRAAQEAKTFREAIDATKDAVSTGWMITYETIFGDYQQAKELWTDVANGLWEVFAAGSEYRNEMLKEWADLGGRDDLIGGFYKFFGALGSIMGPIKEGFRDIFPKTTADTLVKITKTFSNLMSKFQEMTDLYEPQLSRIGKGFGAIASIVKNVLELIFNIGVTIAKAMGPLVDILIDAAAWIGDFFVAINDGLSSMGFFSDALSTVNDGLGSMFSWIAELAKSGINKLSDILFGDTDETLKFTERLKDNMDSAFGSGSKLQGVLTWIGDKLEAIRETVRPITDAIANMISRLWDGIKEAFSNLTFDSLLGIFSAGSFVVIAKSVKGFFDSLGGAADNFKGFGDNLKGILTTLGDALKDWSTNIKADSIKKIAVSVGILAASLFVLATIDGASLATSVGAVTTMMVELIAAMAVINKMKLGKTWNLTLITTGMLILATAIAILAGAVSKLGKLSPNQLTKGFMAITLLIGSFIVVSKKLNTESDGMIKTSFALLIFASAIKSLTKSVTGLAELSFDQMLQGLAGLAGILAAVILTAKMLESIKVSPSTGLAFVLLSTAIVSLATALKIMSKLDPVQWIPGFMALIGFLAVGALVLSSMKSGALAGAGAMLILANAMVILSIAMKILSTIGIEDIVKGLGAIAAALVIFAVAMKLMKGGLLGAAAMVVMAGAIAMLTPSLIALSLVPLEKIVNALIGLAGVFVILGIAGLMLGSLIPEIILLSAAIGVLGIGILAMGAGISMFATSLILLVGSAKEIMAALRVIVLGMLALMVEYVQGIIEGFTTVLTTLTEQIPKIVGAIVGMFTEILEEIAERLPDMIQAAADIILAFLQGIADNLPRIVQAAIDIGVNFIDTLTENLPRIIDAAFRYIISFVNGLADAIRNNRKAIVEAGWNLISALVSGIFGGVGDLLGEVGKSIGRIFTKIKESLSLSSLFSHGSSVASNLISGLTGGVSKALGSVWSWGKSIGSNLLGGAKNALGIKSPSKEMGGIGTNSVQSFVDKVRAGLSSVGKVSTDLGNALLDPLTKIIDDIEDTPVAPRLVPVVDLDDVNALRSNMETLRNLDISGSVSRSKDIEQTISNKEEVTVNHKFDRLVVEGVNDEGEFVASAEYAVETILADIMRRQQRR